MANEPQCSEQHAEAIFRVRGVTKIYQMGEVQVQALRGVDLDLYAGEFVVLLGPSGSGKSTLLNILGGLDTPTAGTVVYGDHDLSIYDDTTLTTYRREHVGFVFQFYNLIPSLTARENVALVTEIAERFSVALVALAQTLKDVYQVSVWPSLVFLQRDGYLGRIDKMHDWSAFLGLIDDMLQRQPGRNPGVGVPVVPG